MDILPLFQLQPCQWHFFSSTWKGPLLERRGTDTTPTSPPQRVFSAGLPPAQLLSAVSKPHRNGSASSPCSPGPLTLLSHTVCDRLCSQAGKMRGGTEGGCWAPDKDPAPWLPPILLPPSEGLPPLARPPPAALKAPAWMTSSCLLWGPGSPPSAPVPIPSEHEEPQQGPEELAAQPSTSTQDRECSPRGPR